MSTKKNPLYTTHFLGEHHMGASSLDFELAKAIKGMKKFRTTNGRVLEDQNGRFLILYDALVALILDFQENAVYHYLFPVTQNDPELTLEGDNLNLSFLASVNGSKKLCLNLKSKNGLQPGFGPVRNGKFPSAYP